jgi:hypothetical protein
MAPYSPKLGFLQTLDMRKSWPFLFLLLLCGTSLRGQDDLRQDSVFFLQQAEAYQVWLDRAGFGKYLKVHELVVKEEKLLLNLAFHPKDTNLLVARWKGLEIAYKKKLGFNLEEQLYYQAIALLEVDVKALVVNINLTANRRKTTKTYRRIYFSQGRIHTYSPIISSNTRPNSVIGPRRMRGTVKAIKPIKFFPQGAEGGTFTSVRKLQLRLTKEKVYACILEYARNRFAMAGIDGEIPEINVLESHDNLLFQVVNVRKEVLKNTNLCGWLESLGLDCFWAKRELLTFLFTYDANGSGIIITGDISGKVGSTSYASARKGSYKNMETNFADELLAYINDFTVEVSRKVGKCP